MVSGLLVPTLGALFWSRASAAGAIAAIVIGGGLTLSLEGGLWTMPGALGDVGLAPTAYGLVASLVAFVTVSKARPEEHARTLEDS